MSGESSEGVAGGVAPRRPITGAGHASRIVAVVAMTAVLFVWLGRNTEVFLADGLRYIGQARAIDRGAGIEALERAIDHPMYPVAIAAAHRAIGGDDPASWQAAAQGASMLAGLLLVVPFYLVSRDLFGDDAAFPAALLYFALPVTSHVFADALSESTFLLFWTWGLWGALRFLRDGGPRPLALAIGGAGLAYLTRPEGLLLPAALGLTLLLHARWLLRGLGRRGLIAAAVMVAGVVVVAGPYVALKGGLSTKPSVARLLGRAPRSHALAVERQRPLEPGQSEWQTAVLAARAVGRAVAGGTTLPLLGLAALGLLAIRPAGPASRQWTLLAVIGASSLLALWRLHATGGYCTPRHAMIPTLPLVPASIRGLQWLAGSVRGRIGGAWTRPVLQWGGVAGLLLLVAPASVTPLNPGLRGYREAGDWLAGEVAEGERVVDVTGWSQFYGGRGGYTFADLAAAEADPAARWVVVRESHLVGPWWYCEDLRRLVAGRRPVREFRSAAGGRPTRVLVFDRASSLAEGGGTPGTTLRR